VTLARLDADRLERLVAAGRGVLAEIELEAILDRLLATACELTGARYAALGILDEDRRRLARFVAHGTDEETRRAIGHPPRGLGILGLLIEDPRPLRLHDLTEHPASSGFPEHHPPMRGFLGVPILIRGEAWGNLYLAEKEGGDFHAQDEEAVVVLADWAAIAIEHARLYGSVDARRAELERAVRRYEATAAIARAVGGETDVERVLELIVERGRALVGAGELVILLPEGPSLVAAARAGDGEGRGGGLWRPGEQIPLAGSPAGEALRTGAPRHIEEPVPAVLVPLTFRGRALGVLAASEPQREDGGFADEDHDVLHAFAASAATAVGTARTVAADRLRRSMEAAEAERRRWARELHDETLQGLAALKVLLAGAARHRDPDRMRAAMLDAAEHTDREIAGLRAIVTELRPAALDELGLRPALVSLIQRTRDGGLEVEADLELPAGPGRLPPELETTVYRLVQEALTNVVKHAGATRAEVGVRAGGGVLDVRVADDGSGLDPQRPTSGFGLLGMSERVEMAGGELEIAAAGRGTVVRARLPLPG
jgi:signal transduction histidine kinase